MTIVIDSLRTQLSKLNEELAALTQQEPLELTHHRGGAEDDSLFLYGIVGGKDVGKTTIINQLAGARISIDTDILDEGTSIAVAYCHEEDLPVLQKRLLADMAERVRYVPHDRDILKNVVLVDFPDFDSRFVSHREDVMRLNKHLQGIVWVTSPRKYGDHEFIEQLESVAQSNKNYFIVFNKVDQLDGRVDLQTVRDEVVTYLEHECKVRDLPPLAEERVLLVSAQKPKDYEFPKLHDRLIRVHSPIEIARAKAENIRTEFEKNIVRIREYYHLDEKVQEIDKALVFLSEETQNQFPKAYYETVQQRLLLMEIIQRRISHGLFRQRVESWPILRLLCHPLAGLVGFLAGRFTPSQKSMDSTETPRDLLRFEGVPVSVRIQQMHIALEERIPFPTPELQEMPDYTSLADREASVLIQHYEDRVITRIRTGIQAPNAIKKFLVYLPLIWFPLLQPVIYHLSINESTFFSLAEFSDMLTFMISLLSAESLLQSLIFLILFYIVWLLLLYANGARKVQQQGEEEFQTLWFEEFIPWVQAVLSRPVQDLRTLWVEKRTQLEQIEKDIQAEVARILEARS